MKTLFACSALCAGLSILAEAILCLFVPDDAPLPWNSWDKTVLALMASIVVWTVTAVWSGSQLWRGEPDRVPLWIRILVTLIAAAYVLGPAYKFLS